MASKEYEELVAKVEKYEEMLDSVLSEKDRKIFKIEAGPFTNKGKDYYRVGGETGSTLVSFSEDSLFNTPVKSLEPKTEVVVIGNEIVAVVPQPLILKTNLPTEFKLISWDEIGGLRSQIKNIREAVETPLQNAKLAKEFGLNPLKGLLLFGPAGCGKTLIAKAIASMILQDNKANDDSFIYIKGAELLSKFVGETERKIGEIFKRARKYEEKTGKKAVLFIDEAEAILPVRGSGISSDVDKTIVPTFLSEMDGLDENGPFVILSTNLPKSIDSAILRSGRIDLKIEITRPTIEDTIDIFKVHLKNVLIAEPIEILSKKGASEIFISDGTCNIVSGALIEAVVKLATLKALTRYKSDKKTPKGIVTEDLIEAIKVVHLN